jgi:NAD-dependent dihydropyrimidine dehydrogenase PreA subunit/flavodoxin
MIFYVSGTGNTRWAVEQIAKATGEDIINIGKISSAPYQCRLSEGERIGFCFPVHGWRPTKVMREFIGHLQIENTEGHYCYALCTAGDNIGMTMNILQQDLKEIGLYANSTFSLIMPESYIGLPFMDVDTPEREKEKTDKAATELQEYIGYIVGREKEIHRLVIGHWPRINSLVIGSYFVSHLVTDKPFRVESERCVKCGICTSVCPTGAITFSPGEEPKWKNDGSCLTCFTCYHHCPHHVIEYGNRTKHKGQYFFGHK